MKKRKIGRTEVGEIGLGCMGMTHAYGPSDEKESLAVLAKALEMGCNFWDTADFYSAGKNEELLAKALTSHREEVFLSTKVGNVFDSTQIPMMGVANELNGSAEYIKKSVESSLKRLKTDYIDLYYLHRVDPKTPIEESVSAMAELVKEGKIKYVGLSEASVETIQRASKIHRITALQSEYSIWYRELEQEIIPLCQTLNIKLVPFAPLGRGFLTGEIQHTSDLSENDWRKSFPRFQDANLKQNMMIVEKIKKLASKYQCSSATIALAWLLTKNHQLIPIPGTRHINYLLENIEATNICLNEEEMTQLSKFKVYGDRFPSFMENSIDK
ncbi:aldo/keto reductase [Erwinia sp. CPCC 100877]|nr:aldo/keto reductase [Erwinia sp. CPCC 100877]